ncbi:MAG: hypothetical protein HYZ87_00445 [Candidatus Omnitrophica bacterium]|nr:hypothetical protein [Candidatus Omnitrophota bacterium]
MLFTLKIVIASVLISYASWLSGKKPVLAGFIIALPLSSLISIIFSYFEYRDMAKLNEYALSILVAVPLSLVFFVPFILNKWLRMNFTLTMVSAVGLLAVAYFIHSSLFKSV